MKILTEFLQKVSKEQLTGVISLAALLVLGLVFLLGRVSIPAYDFILPQTGLGIGLLAVAAGWGGLAFLLFKRNRNGATNSESMGDQNVLFGAAVSPEPPRIRVQVTGEGEGMSFWKNDGAGELRAWLDVVNFTSAPVKIDRLLGDITVANATVATFSHFKRQNVAAVSATSIFVHAELSTEHIKKIEFQLNQQRDPSAGLNLTVYVVTEKGETELHPRLATGNCRFVNFARGAVN